jgi:hypothetical protein
LRSAVIVESVTFITFTGITFPSRSVAFLSEQAVIKKTANAIPVVKPIFFIITIIKKNLRKGVEKAISLKGQKGGDVGR